MKLNTTEELIEDIRNGRMVIMMDDEDRENEGDLVMAAECVTAEDINFMARFGRGLICLTLTREHCRRLNLPLMARNSDASHITNFTVSIEAAEGVTTGISAADRALTIQKAVAKDARPSDLVQPGHVFPLMAQPGGVLSRAGHTEAACDMARLAGLGAAGVIVEILNDDGTMARRPDLEIFAREHGLKIGTIADLIKYRTENEKTVERMVEAPLKTEYGEFRVVAYQDSVNNDLHLALIKGEIHPDQPILVRVHVENPVHDLTGSVMEDGSWPLKDVLERVGKEENGIVVILCNQHDPVDLIKELQEYRDQPQDEHSAQKKHNWDIRTIGLGSQILSDLGVRKMRVLSAPRKIHALSGFDLEIVEYVN
ncbi:MAG: bifunctional 3,4-dihydroxy-2-butanone-4-phosphate synthase/GTP cyclohydrolase II [Gammaproteobacteria bacterium]|nr:bifunctional 3,4-dihydroxy-2-butanone-4-phosphate synthase/GTP cyclohydrolase II [Gammaproteobacteria bacterium]